MRASSIEEEKTPRIERRVKQALHTRIDVDARTRIPGAEEMRVAVPDLGRIDAVPRGCDELMPRKMRRQGAATWIPEALLGPIAPGGDPGGGAAGDKT